jgi:hypothetical protein
MGKIIIVTVGILASIGLFLWMGITGLVSLIDCIKEPSVASGVWAWAIGRIALALTISWLPAWIASIIAMWIDCD